MHASNPSSSTTYLHLSGGTGDADRAASLDLRELTDDRADRARRRGNNHRLARLGLADVHQADECGHARHAEHADRRRDRHGFRIELAQLLPRRNAVGLPAVVAGDEVAFLEVGVARLDHLADGVPAHHLADLDGRRIGLGVAHPAAHIGIEREIDGSSEDLAVLRPAGTGASARSKLAAVGSPVGRDLRRIWWFMALILSILDMSTIDGYINRRVIRPAA